MRISDWSSDVCSSDLVGRHLRQFEADRLKPAYRPTELNPFLRVFQRVFQAPPRQTYGACRGMRPCDLTATRCQIEGTTRSEEHTSELQSLMRNSYAVFCLKKKKKKTPQYKTSQDIIA